MLLELETYNHYYIFRIFVNLDSSNITCNNLHIITASFGRDADTSIAEVIGEER